MTLKLRELKPDNGKKEDNGSSPGSQKIITEDVGTVWGFQGVPRRKADPDQNFFRWYQVGLEILYCLQC